MPLQGLEQATKDDLLRKVVQRKLSLKELREAADNIKKKKYVVAAFLKFTGEEEPCLATSTSCHGGKTGAI